MMIRPDKPLIEDLQDWRAERPDEWVMDSFIRKAKKLEEENKRFRDFIQQMGRDIAAVESDYILVLSTLGNSQ